MEAWIDELLEEVGAMIGADQPRPDPALDRWLLTRLYDEGPFTAETFVVSKVIATAGPKNADGGGPALRRLTDGQALQWLKGAFDRGLLETRTTRLGGGPFAPPELVLTYAGFVRLQDLRPRDGVLGTLGRKLRGKQLAKEERAAWTRAVSHLPDVQLTIERPTSRRADREIAVQEPPTAEEALRRLRQIEHVVVVMMENRSFDHMLGYLRLHGQHNVDGLTGDEAETWEGTRIPVARLGDTRLPKVADPAHSATHVADQLNPQIGFAADFAKHRRLNPAIVLGYYTGEDLPVYDHLAHEFCICDQWFSSVPGATWPNRLYALAGQAPAGREGLFDGDKPLFDVHTFARELPPSPDVWRWYSHDPATLRLADGTFRPPPRLDGRWEDRYREHFRFFDRRAVSDVTVSDEGYVVDPRASFLDDARTGDLPCVSWIDPNFVDLSVLDPHSADDHPPSDVLAGQAFVLDVYRALVQSPAWPRTMLVVTYDEHGGFYDHVTPPPVAGEDGRTYGVRVPALVASPYVPCGVVSKVQFDHTSLIRTILERFAEGDGWKERMPARACDANHLGMVLADQARDRPPAIAPVEAALERRRLRARRLGTVRPDAFTPTLEGFPAEIAKGAVELRARGLPAAQP